MNRLRYSTCVLCLAITLSSMAHMSGQVKRQSGETATARAEKEPYTFRAGLGVRGRQIIYGEAQQLMFDLNVTPYKYVTLSLLAGQTRAERLRDTVEWRGGRTLGFQVRANVHDFGIVNIYAACERVVITDPLRFSTLQYELRSDPLDRVVRAERVEAALRHATWSYMIGSRYWPFKGIYVDLSIGYRHDRFRLDTSSPLRRSIQEFSLVSGGDEFGVLDENELHLRDDLFAAFSIGYEFNKRRPRKG